MTPETGGTTQLLRRTKAGDRLALNALIAHTRDRLLTLASYMLRCDFRFRGVCRFEETDDVLQSALVRLGRALAAPTAPDTAEHFWNLAQLQLRRELRDLSRHYNGRFGPGTNHHSDAAGRPPDDPCGPLHAAADPAVEPESLADWTRFHEAVDRLPDDEQRVFGLVWYAGLNQAEVAEELGVSVETVKRRWCVAKVLLDRALGGEPPS